MRFSTRRWIQDLELRVSRIEQYSSEPVKLDEPMPVVTEIDSSPKAADLDIFSAKVSFSDYELRDIIEAIEVAGPRFSKSNIVSKARHAFDLVTKCRLERGLGGASEPDIDEAIDRVVAIRSRAGWSKTEAPE